MGKIFIAADVLPTPSNADLFKKADTEQLLGDKLIKLMEQADFCIADLEGPLCDEESAIEKSGPCIKADTETINGLKKMRWDCLSLANNHIMDYGIRGFHSTVETLQKKGISYTGAGNDIAEARIPFIFELENQKIGLITCAEYEFTIATDDEAGANPFDPLNTPDDVRKLKEESDYVIVLYHGGKEHYRYPAPYLQKICRKLVEKGADLVICNHSHCIGSMEKYGDGMILYGQGNFLFDRSENEFRNSGLVVSVDPFSKEVEFIPIVKNGNAVRMAEGKEKEGLINDFKKRSEEIKDGEFIRKAYGKFSDEMISQYECQSLWFIGKVLMKLNLTKALVGKKARLHMLNSLRCEAHRDLMREGLERSIGKRK